MHCNHHTDDRGTGQAGPGLLMNGLGFTNNFIGRLYNITRAGPVLVGRNVNGPGLEN